MELTQVLETRLTDTLPDGWSQILLRDLADIQRGASPRPISSPVWFSDKSAVGWVRISDVSRSDGKTLRETRDYLSDRGIANSRFLPAGTLVMSICATVGIPVVTGIDACIHDGFVGFTNLRGVDRDFLLYKLKELEPTFISLGQSGTQVNLNSDLVRDQTVDLPPLPEQRAIAAALTEVDDLVAALDALIEKKRAVKTAAMQRLLTGRQRLAGFEGAWETKTLDQVGSFSKGRGVRKSEVSASGLPCVRYGELYTVHKDVVREFATFIPRSVAETAQRLKEGDILFAGSGETKEEIGTSVAYLGDEEAYAGSDIVILSPNGQSSAFLGYALNMPSVAAQKASMGQGDAVVHIHAKHLRQLEVRLPGEDEQKAVAAILSDMDAEIAALAARRDKTRQVKTGMMQELLTGRTRLV